jgi:outer membrane protein TolC
VRQNVRASIVRATIRAETARQAIEAARERQQAPHAAFQLAQDRHRAGTSLLVEVLDAELAKLGAELALVTSISGFNRAQHDLLYAVGGSDPTESGALDSAPHGE